MQTDQTKNVNSNKAFHPSGTSQGSLHELAFNNTAQACIIFSVKTGKMVTANNAACELLGYTEEEILGKRRSGLFNVKETNFRKMLLKRKAEGQAIANVHAILKNGDLLPCEISSSLFKDQEGIETSVTTIRDMRPAIAIQKRKDIKKDKLSKSNIQKEQHKSEVLLEQTNQWLKYFAETSYDVMWDWDISTGKIYVGNSIEDVFGYKIENDLIDYDILGQYLEPTEKLIVQNKIKRSLSSRKKSWEDSFSILRKDGVMASSTSRASIIRDENGQAIRLVGATQDVSKILTLEKALQDQEIFQQEDKEKIRLITKLSFDVIWDWDLTTNQVFIGEGFKELFGYTIKKNKGDMTKDWVNHIHPDDKGSISAELANTIKSKAKHWKHAYRIIRSDGTIAKVYVRADIIRSADGRAYRMIGAVQDLTRQKKLEEQLDLEIKNNNNLLQTYEENFNLIFNSSSDILYDIDLVNDAIIVSDAFEKKLGYKVINNKSSLKEWISHVHPEDKVILKRDFQRVLNTSDADWKFNFRYLRFDNAVVAMSGNAVVLRRPNGEAYRVIGSMQDADKQKHIEKELIPEIESRENEMIYALNEARIAERSEIGKELHDNVNQLLGASKLYVEMAKKGGKNSKMYLDRSTEYTLTAIEEIRKLSKGLASDALNVLGLLGSIRNLAADIMEVQPLTITLNLDTSIEKLINDHVKLNLYRIVQEQFNNIIKHANASTISVSFRRNEHLAQLTITDDGKGFDVFETQEGIGLKNINERARIIHANSETVSEIGKGTTFSLKLNM